MSSKYQNDKTFMQSYREWKRRGSRLMPTLDYVVVASGGIKLAELISRYDALDNKLVRCCVHTRINYRAHAVKLDNWNHVSLQLNKMWRSWA